MVLNNLTFRDFEPVFVGTYRARQCLLTSGNAFFPSSELGFCSHTGLNLAHGEHIDLTVLKATVTTVKKSLGRPPPALKKVTEFTTSGASQIEYLPPKEAQTLASSMWPKLQAAIRLK
jgi:hypothetical protein